MSCEILDILDRGAFMNTTFDYLEDYTLGARRITASDIVLREPGWTLFAYDFKQSKAVFLDVGAGCDLSKAPFCYLMQFERATRMALVSFTDMVALSTQLPDPEKLVQLFNIGHCGSTLLHHVFNHAPKVWCVSEPMWLLDLAMARATIESSTMLNLTRAGLRFLTLFEGAATADLMVVKHFSQSTTQFRMLHEVLPAARCLFMYRDGRSWTNSLYHFVQKVGGSMILEGGQRAFNWSMMSGNSPAEELEGIVDLNAAVVKFDTLAAAAWALHMRQYREAIADGVPMLALRYNELISDREETIGRIFEYCGISTEAVTGALVAFDADSHEGTRTARSVAVTDFSDENYRRVAAVFANPRVAVDADLILPDSFNN